jgi:hypothetical protein
LVLHEILRGLINVEVDIDAHEDLVIFSWVNRWYRGTFKLGVNGALSLLKKSLFQHFSILFSLNLCILQHVGALNSCLPLLFNLLFDLSLTLAFADQTHKTGLNFLSIFNDPSALPRIHSILKHCVKVIVSFGRLFIICITHNNLFNLLLVLISNGLGQPSYARGRPWICFKRSLGLGPFR